MEQTIINFLLGGFGALLGFLLNSVWQAVKDLQIADKELATKVASIEVHVVGHYITKEDFGSALNRVFAKLEVIENKLDGKADKA